VTAATPPSPERSPMAHTIVTIAGSLRKEVLAVDPEQPIAAVRPMMSWVEASTSSQRYNTMLLGLFAVLAVVLAATGIYGVMSYTVAQRTHEIGVRMALGARRFDVLKIVLRQGMLLALGGVVLGLLGAYALTRVMAAFLFLQKMSTESHVALITENLKDDEEFQARDMTGIEIPKGVEVFELYGSLFFGAVRQFKESIRIVAAKPRVLILRMRQVLSIDASGIRVLEELAEEAKAGGYVIVFSEVSRSVYRVMRQTGFVEKVGRKNFAGDIFTALVIAKQHLDSPAAKQ